MTWVCEGCGKVANAHRKPSHHRRRGERCGPFKTAVIAADGQVVQAVTPYTSQGGPLRQSLLAAFDRCPLSARFDVEGFRDYSTGPQAFGSVFHEIALRMFVALRDSRDDHDRCERQMSTEEAVNVAREVMADPAMPHLNTAQMHDMISLVCKFCDRKWTPENFMTIGREHERLYADIRCPDGKVRTLTGLPDLVGVNYPDGVTIVDLKTSFAVPPAPRDRNTVVACPKCAAPRDMKCVNGKGTETSSHPERAKLAAGVPVQGRQYLSERGIFQLDAYSYLLMRNTPAVQWCKLFELFVRKNEVREAILTRDDLEHVEHHLGIELQRLDTALQEGPASKLWEPRDGKHCSYCPRPSHCPIDPEERGEYAITDDEMADEYARRYLRSDGLRDGYRKAMAHWFETTGYAPRAGDMEIRFDGGKGSAFEVVSVA